MTDDKKIYLVTSGQYSDYRICGAFSTVAETQPGCHRCPSPHAYTIRHEDETEEDFCELCMDLFTHGSEAGQYAIVMQPAAKNQPPTPPAIMTEAEEREAVKEKVIRDASEEMADDG